MFIPNANDLNPIEAARMADEQAMNGAAMQGNSTQELQNSPALADTLSGEPVSTEPLAAEPIPGTPVQSLSERAIDEVYPRRYSDKENNLRIMRERAEQAERRAMELERAMYMSQAPESQREQVPAEYEDETLIEGKHLKKYDKTVKEMRSELEETKKQLAAFNATSAELQLRAKYSDFDAIVNDDNIERLKYEKPAHYRSILANPDLRDKGEAAYEIIKTFLKPQTYEHADRRIAENKVKPKSSPTAAPQASDSPLSRAGDYDRRRLSDDRKKEIYEEMRQYSR